MLNASVIQSDCLPSQNTLVDIGNFSGFQILSRVDNITAKTLNIDFPSACQLTIVFSIDTMPLLPIKLSSIENYRIFNFHKYLRKSIGKKNKIAFSTSEKYTWQLCEQLLSTTQFNTLLSEYQELFNESKTDAKVLKVLANSAYNKVEIIELDNKIRVRKTFRRWQLPCLEREIIARQELAPHIKEISEITAIGKYHFDTPLYDTQYHWDNNKNIRPFSAYRTKLIFNVVQKIWERGWALIDFHPGNFIFQNENDFKIIDFEYAVKHNDTNVPFEQSWDMMGAPDHVLSKMPAAPNMTYKKIWLPMVGLQFKDIKNIAPDSNTLWRQYFNRLALQAPRAIRKNLQNKMYTQRQSNVTCDGKWLYLSLRKKYR